MPYKEKAEMLEETIKSSRICNSFSKPEFRVWEPLNKKMHYMEFALYEWCGDQPYEEDQKMFALPARCQGLRRSYTTMNLDALEIMEFTGLVDDDGKKIWEGNL